MTALEALAALPTAPPEDELGLPVPVARLSDEELILLGGEHPVVVLPHYESLSPAAQTVAVRTAHRSLLAHGIEPDDTGAALQVPQEVSDLLDVRGAAPWTLVIRIQTDVIQTDVIQTDVEEPHADVRAVVHELYAHVVDELVLLEGVSADGMHDFHVLTVESIGPALQQRVDDPRLRDGHGPAITLDLAAIAHGVGDVTLSALGPLITQVDATVWRRGPQSAPPLLGLLLGSDGCWATRNTFGAAGPVLLEPIPATAVGALLSDLLRTEMTGPRPALAAPTTMAR